MSEIKTDSRGRITIPKDIRDKFGEKYRLIELKDEIKLIPIPEKPLNNLKNIKSKDLENKSIKKIRKKAIEKGKEQSKEILE